MASRQCQFKFFVLTPQTDFTDLLRYIFSQSLGTNQAGLWIYTTFTTMNVFL